MSMTLTEQLHEVGVSCRALAAWTRCEGGRKDMCEHCFLGGPERCDSEVIKALVERVVTATEQTDSALQMVTYWKGVAGRLCDAVMDKEGEHED
jgi:hypothetical protein